MDPISFQTVLSYQFVFQAASHVQQSLMRGVKVSLLPRKKKEKKKKAGLLSDQLSVMERNEIQWNLRIFRLIEVEIADQ